jgi:flavin-dependent dehydrogenase
MNDVFDALIIGGGPAGSTAAIMLASAGWSVAVLERSEFPRRKVCGEFVSATIGPLFRELRIADAFDAAAGPEVRRIGLFVGDRTICTATKATGSWGRALGREHLDTLLLDRAAAAGARVWQPCTAVEISKADSGFRCEAIATGLREHVELRARTVIAAHGSWEPGRLPTQPARREFRPSDLFGFKGHLVGSQLPGDLMPLIAFPDGYGGMVHSDNGRVSLSCCIRRDRLELVRRHTAAANAAEAVVEYIKQTCPAAGAVLSTARVENNWMSAGPIRPGLRPRIVDGIFRVGNAAGEAHPVIAEGITMAMQSAEILSRCLIRESLEEAARDYAAAWRTKFAARVRTSALIARWAMNPWLAACSAPIVTLFPRVLTIGARCSGKNAIESRLAEQPQ